MPELTLTSLGEAAAMRCSSASAGGQLEQPSEVKSSATTMCRRGRTSDRADVPPGAAEIAAITIAPSTTEPSSARILV